MTETDIRLAVNIARERLKKDFGITALCTDTLKNVRATTVTELAQQLVDDTLFWEL